jgi:hypothetical protein
MTFRTRYCTLLEGLVLSASLLSARSPPSSLMAWRAYAFELARTCPAEHRERLSSENLNYLSGRFTDRLPPAQQSAIKSTIVRSCSARQADKDCELDGFVLAAVQLGLINRFAVEVCAASANPLQTDAVRSPHW